MSAIPDFLTDSKQSNEYELLGVQTVLNREHNEPHDGFEPVPFWMTLIFAGLLSWGGWYFATYAGDYDAAVLDRPDPKPVGTGPAKPTIDYETAPLEEMKKLGARVFNNCMACHQTTGEGLPGQYPPLNKSEWVSGEQSSHARLSRILIGGLTGNISVRGKTFNGAMPAWGPTLKDEQIAAVLTYIRNNWDNAVGDIVRPSEVKAARAKIGSEGMTQAKLMAIPVDFADVVVAPPAPKAGREKRR